MYKKLSNAIKKSYAHRFYDFIIIYNTVTALTDNVILVSLSWTLKDIKMLKDADTVLLKLGF